MGTRRRLAALQDWLTNHFAVTLLLSGAILAGGLALASRMTIEQDIGAMLPDGPGSPREAARLLECKQETPPKRGVLRRELNW